MRLFFSVLVALSLLSLPARAQSVRVVDVAGGPGTEFTSLDAAVQGSASGDVLLVRSGDYDIGTAIGTSLVLQADEGATVRVSPGLTVRGLPAGESVVVRGLSLGGVMSLAFPGSAIAVFNCQGSVWFEDCTIPGTGSLASSSGGASVLDSASVVFNRCAFGPAFDHLIAFQNFVTVNLRRTTAHLFDCTVVGANGLRNCDPSTEGKPAILAEGGELWITGSVITGGQGANGDASLCHEGGSGASGLVLTGAGPHVFLTDSRITSGTGGAGFGGAPDGPTPAPIRASPAQVTRFPGAERRLSVSSPLRDDRGTVLGLHGVPGDQVWLVASPRPGPRILLPFLNRPLLLAAPYVLLPLGTLDASGTLGLVLGPRDLGSGIQTASFSLQALFWNTTLHERAWSAPSHLLVVDAAF